KCSKFAHVGCPLKHGKQEGHTFLSHTTPHVASAKDLGDESAKHGYLAKEATGCDYLVEFCEFYVGVVDLTNPEAYDWFKDVIKINMTSLGCSGWFAVFVECLPTGRDLHNVFCAWHLEHPRPTPRREVNYDSDQAA
ncbi:TIM-barrel domain-containing protein, partial [Salmonella enterica]|uniref:TIM-barrel domain-containing protein n=1 Tax=Salmonella enterica TaxID=28901 RepID=UPI00398C76E3